MRLLEFKNGNEDFGFPLQHVREVITFSDFTAIPNTPDYFLGITSLRQQVLPLIDLRIRLGMLPTLNHETSVIVCETPKGIIGVVVDEIHNVISCDDADMMNMGSENSEMAVDFVKGVLRKDKKLIPILDLPKLLSSSDVDLIKFQTQKKTLQQDAA